MKKEIEIGEAYSVDFFKNKRGGKPICRIEGMVGFISDDEKEFCAPGSSWIVEVQEIQEKCVVVTLMLKIRSPYENEKLLSQKTQELKETLQREPKKRIKQKVNYPYLASYERR